MLALAVVVFVLQIYSLCSFVPVDEDDSHYLYVAQLIGQGLIPYKDFALVHPPLLFLIGGLLSGVGLPPVSVQMMFLVLNLSVLFIVYGLGKALFRDTWAAVGAVALLLCSSVLFGYDFRTMALRPLATVLITWGFWEYFKERPGRAGVLLALSCLTCVLSFVPVGLFFLVFGVVDYRKALRALAGFLAVSIPAFAGLSLVPHFWQLVVGFQVGAMSSSISQALIAGQYFHADACLFGAFVVGAVLLALRREKSLLPFAVWTACIFAACFLLCGRMKIQNFELITPGLALVGAYTLTLIRGRVRAVVLVLLLAFGLFRMVQTCDKMVIFNTHALVPHSLTQVLSVVPQPCQTGRSPMIALQTGIKLPRWYYGTDFYYFLHSGKCNDPANWRELLDNAKSILWQRGLWDMMPPAVKKELDEKFSPASGWGATIYVKNGSKKRL